MRTFRIWLSWLIFKKIFHWPEAEQRAEAIISGAVMHDKEQIKKCRNCDSNLLIEDIRTGGFNWEYITIHRCQNCGNTQPRGINFLDERKELKRARITADYDRYRYRLLTNTQWLVFCIIIGFLIIRYLV